MGKVKNLCVQLSTVYIVARCEESSIKYGKFQSEQYGETEHIYDFSSEKERFFDERS